MRLFISECDIQVGKKKKKKKNKRLINFQNTCYHSHLVDLKWIFIHYFKRIIRADEKHSIGSKQKDRVLGTRADICEKEN